MIKRDIIQRVLLTESKDDGGGRTVEKEYKERVECAVSILASSMATMTDANLKQELTIRAVTNFKLDENENARYEYSGRLYQVRLQIKQGPEYFSTLVETPA